MGRPEEESRVRGGAAGCCRYWQPARHLRTRRPNRKAQAEAEELQALYVRGLAAEMGFALSDAERHAFVRDARGIRRDWRWRRRERFGGW